MRPVSVRTCLQLSTSTEIPSSTSLTLTAGVAVVDVNGDRKPDLVIASPRANVVSVLLGNGNGTFQAEGDYPVTRLPDWVFAADVSGDTKLDLVVIGNEASVLVGDGN